METDKLPVTERLALIEKVDIPALRQEMEGIAQVEEMRKRESAQIVALARMVDRIQDMFPELGDWRDME